MGLGARGLGLKMVQGLGMRASDFVLSSKPWLGSTSITTMKCMWMVVKIRVPFWVP